MSRDFNLKKFNKDRNRSLEGSKKGDYKLIAPTKLDTCCDVIVEKHRKERHPLFRKAEACGHKRILGCDLPFPKRTKSECEACL